MWTDHADAQPALIRIDVATFLESVQYAALLRVLERHCHGLPIATSSPPPQQNVTPVDEAEPDEWLAETQLSQGGRVLRAVLVGLTLIYVSMYAVTAVAKDPPLQVLMTLAVIAVALVATLPLPAPPNRQTLSRPGTPPDRRNRSGRLRQAQPPE
ncbi:hypothetical protein GORHZ_052_00080 [Gordonia rhizosphera NBRC 16068]|uniref:Uncharacterized protein n=1 Tax=Gordonia rhizosphera NBRC 16068 TaxID=1108045 RepID=K6VQF1_9ACTN|nr:hypothetical protein GORHZ_052_00080 [Gordonia rhizosphera NBRC 16068]